MRSRFIKSTFNIIGLREIQMRRFERQWQSMQTSLTFNEGNILDGYSGSDQIIDFLQLADLNAFEDKLVGEGVSKIKHLVDVTVDDLPLLGIVLCAMYVL